MSGVSLMYGDLKSEVYSRPKSWYRRLSVLHKIEVTALSCFIFGSLAESGNNAGNIKTIGDSIWWCTVTMATVGYGDKYPITVMGKTIAVFVMLGGCTTFALTIAYVGNNFMDREKASDDSINTIEELGVELKKIQSQIKKLKKD
jgi:hypothetical protein